MQCFNSDLPCLHCAMYYARNACRNMKNEDAGVADDLKGTLSVKASKHNENVFAIFKYDTKVDTCNNYKTYMLVQKEIEKFDGKRISIPLFSDSKDKQHMQYNSDYADKLIQEFLTLKGLEYHINETFPPQYVIHKLENGRFVLY